MARQTNRKQILLRLDWNQLADLLHLPEDLTPTSCVLDQNRRQIELTLDAPSAIHDVAPGMMPPYYGWEQVVARRYEEQ